MVRFLLVILLMFAHMPVAKKSVSENFDGKVFVYPHKPYNKKFSDVLKFLLNRKGSKWPVQAKNQYQDKPPLKVEGANLRVSLVNHSTVLIQTQGLNILTDPVWSDYASPFSFAGPKRTHQPAVHFEDLPKIDVVVISHNHYDHLDLATVKRLQDAFQPVFLVGLGVKGNMESTVPNANIIELDWGDVYDKEEHIKFHFCPCQHWSARGLFDQNKTLWGAFVLETKDGNIYFAGDTGYSPHFTQAKEKFKNFRLALMPIGAYEPRWFMQYAHVDPKEALQGFKDLNANYGLAIHHGCFPLADEGPGAAKETLDALIENEAPDLKEKFKVVPPGKEWWVPEA